MLKLYFLPLICLITIACSPIATPTEPTNTPPKDSTLHINNQQMSDDTIFQLTISLRERSKDSHGYIHHYQLTGNRLVKETSYSGRLRKKTPENQYIILTEAKIKQLDAALKALALNDKDQKEYPISPSGVVLNHQTKLTHKELMIHVSGGQELQQDLFAKRLYRFEILLKYLLNGEDDKFEKLYLRPITD